MSTTAGPQQLTLEDDFCDVISKAAKGTKQPASTLARELGLPAERIAAWLVGSAEPDAEYIDALAALLRLNARALQASLRRSWHPRTALPRNVQGYIQPSHPESNGYLITSDNGREVAMIDPAGDSAALKRRIDRSGLPLRYLFVTHRHNDHAEAAAGLLQAFPAATLIMHEIEAATRTELPPRSRVISDGNRILFGMTEVEVRFTPGHTDGSTCFLFPGCISVGDTLFAGSIGGNFGPTAGYDDQLRNIRARIMSLRGETVILPGHGPATTVALEREHNPFLAE
jgi:hydroxyacylglutathione hydrolase